MTESIGIGDVFRVSIGGTDSRILVVALSPTHVKYVNVRADGYVTPGAQVWTEALDFVRSHILARSSMNMAERDRVLGTFSPGDTGEKPSGIPPLFVGAAIVAGLWWYFKNSKQDFDYDDDL